MEKSTPSTIEEQRRWLRDFIYSQITDLPKYQDFYSHLRVIFAHHGLTVRKVGINFLKSRDWSNPTKREEFLGVIRAFLEKNIK